VSDDGGAETAARDIAPTDIEPVVLADAGAIEPEPPHALALSDIPQVRLRHDLVPAELAPARFFRVMVERVLTNSPINFHVAARELRADAAR
jgi:hypothetical protein